MDLEANHGLDPTQPAHVWLLHHLFLNAINQDANDWAETWNLHKLQIKKQRSRSPRDMFFFGMLQEGPRGMLVRSEERLVDEVVEDIPSYGIDWEVNEDDRLMNHLLEENPQDWQDDNPFTSASHPGQLSEVLCDPPNCPFDHRHLHDLDTVLAQRVDLFSRNMSVRRMVWQEAFAICQSMYSELNVH